VRLDGSIKSLRTVYRVRTGKGADAMTIKEREEELFQRWRTERGYDRFIKDGVFNEETWERQTVKLTFILKDPNWPGGDGDIRENLEKYPNRNHWRTWNNIARWTRALLDGGAFPGFITREERLEQLRRISFLNLKKVGGGSHTRHNELQACAYKDAPFIRKQLLLYLPDMIICCGDCGKYGSAASILERDVLLRPDLREPDLPDGCLRSQDWEWDGGTSWFYTRFPGKERLTPVVCFRHPSKRGSRYEDWQKWYEQLLEVRALLLPPSGEQC